jgi:dethiobiotin synthetase
MGVKTIPSPLVYFKGFTRSYLDGFTGPSTLSHSSIHSSISSSFSSCKYLVIDGVGYPAVGSITGTSNAAVAKTLHAPAVVVTPTGVGNAVDTYDYCASYMRYNGSSVLGCVVNGVAREGFYDLTSVREYVGKGLKERGEKLYGCVPKFEELVEARDDEERMRGVLEGPLGKITEEFRRNVDVKAIVEDAEIWAYR